MTLYAVLDRLADGLTAELGPGTHVGDRLPRAGGDLPTVTLSLDEVTGELRGIGRVPRGTRSGALPVDVVVDLADPRLDLGGGESLELLSADRRTLVLPHGPLVRADGTTDQPFTGSDLTVDDGGPYEVVAGTPTGRQVRPDPDAGTLLLGDPAPESGTLRVRQHVGRWDTRVSRYGGRLAVVVVAVDDALAPLVRDVARLLETPPEGIRLVPRSWGAAGPGRPGEVPTEDARAQHLGYTFDAEIEEPVVPSGGGVITTVAVRQVVDGTTETFAIVRPGLQE